MDKGEPSSFAPNRVGANEDGIVVEQAEGLKAVRLLVRLG